MDSIIYIALYHVLLKALLYEVKMQYQPETLFMFMYHVLQFTCYLMVHHG